MKNQINKYYKSSVILIYTIFNTIFLFISYIYLISIPKWLLVIIIAMNCLLIIFLGKDIKYNVYLKQIALIYCLLFLCEVFIDIFLIEGIYSKYNNIMIALNPILWIISFEQYKNNN